MSSLLARCVLLPFLCWLLAGCAGNSSLNATRHAFEVRPSFSALTEPPQPAKGRMLIRPFADRRPNVSPMIPVNGRSVPMAPTESLAQVVGDAFAEAGRFAGYEVKQMAEPPADFNPSIVVEGEIQSCELSTEYFAGIWVTTHRLIVQVRMNRPGNLSPVWQGRITGSAGNFPSRNASARVAAQEIMLRDSINSAMLDWLRTLDPAAAARVQALATTSPQDTSGQPSPR